MAHEATTMRSLETVHAHMVHSLAPQLATLYDAIAAQQSGSKSSPTFLYEGKRLAHVTDAVAHAVGQYATFAQNTITQAQHNAAHLATQSTVDQLSYVLPPSRHMTANTPDVTKPLSTAMNNVTALVASYAHEAATAVKAAFVVGVSINSTEKQIAKHVTRAIDASRWKSVTIAATAPVQVYRATTLTILDANDIPAWMWVSDKTASVCDVCFAMDGTQHPIYEDMDSHPRCHCIPIPLNDLQPTN
jgi:hypothetical protein